MNQRSVAETARSRLWPLLPRLFSGTHDILNSDAKRFVPLAKEAGVSIDYHEAPGMLHEYPLLPIPEAKRAHQAIAEALTIGGA